MSAEKKNAVTVAEYVTLVRCPHGTLYLNFYDAKGELFATAPMEPAVATELSDRILELLATDPAMTKSLADMPCVGRG